jgi:hypothetical protein
LETCSRWSMLVGDDVLYVWLLWKWKRGSSCIYRAMGDFRGNCRIWQRVNKHHVSVQGLPTQLPRFTCHRSDPNQGPPSVRLIRYARSRAQAFNNSTSHAHLSHKHPPISRTQTPASTAPLIFFHHASRAFQTRFGIDAKLTNPHGPASPKLEKKLSSVQIATFCEAEQRFF